MFRLNAEYKKWTGRLGIDFDELQKLINEGMTKNDFLKMVKTKFVAGMSEKENYPSERVFDKFLSPEFDSYYGIIYKPITDKELKTERIIRESIKDTFIISDNKIIVNNKIIGHKPKTIKGVKCSITYMKNKGFNNLSDEQIIRYDINLERLHKERNTMSKKDIDKYFTIRKTKKRIER